MKTQLRLNSVIPHGVSGPEAGAIALIYTYWLNKYNQNAYSRIMINQIGDTLEEVFIKEGKKVHLNIKYPSPENFEILSNDEQNHIRLKVIHEGLSRIAEKENKLDPAALEKIKKIILENNFAFDLVCKIYKNKKTIDIVAKLIVQPLTEVFKYYIEIEEKNEIKCRIHIYSGGTSTFYAAELFKHGIWEKENIFILRTKENTSEIRINYNDCTIEYANHTQYKHDPYFHMFRTDISEKDKEEAKKDWLYSLPPHIAAAVREDKDN